MGGGPLRDRDRRALVEICARFEVRELVLFGSSARGELRPGSDVDLLVEFMPDAKPTLFDMVELREELKTLFGREIDLVSKDALRAHHNAARRKGILEHTEMLYAA
jgi:hypothetical protein